MQRHWKMEHVSDFCTLLYESAPVIQANHPNLMLERCVNLHVLPAN